MFKKFFNKENKENTNNKDILIASLLIHAAKIDDNYTNFEKISQEIEAAKKTFKKYKWPVIDVTRKSVEETAASVIKIYEISKENV